MGVEDLDLLGELVERTQSWPTWNMGGAGGVDINVYTQAGSFGHSLRDVRLWIALRESDRNEVASLIGWDRGKDAKDKREYKVDPLPDRISTAFSDLLFGDDPKFVPANASDAEKLAAVVEENDLPSEFKRWAADCSSEGEIWWKAYVNPDVSDYPVIEAYSRLDVLPLFRGRRIAAAAFFSDLFADEVKIEGQVTTRVYRHVEMHTDGMVRNRLYLGDITSLGHEIALTDRPETAKLEEEWVHDLPMMLAGRVPNKLGRDWRLGISDYAGIRDLILDLNEARVIAAENARLTAKARMVVPAAALDSNGNFDAGADVLTVESIDTDLDNKNQHGPYAVLEYNFQSTALIEYIDDLISTAMTRVGLAEQFTGGGKGGGLQQQATSGTALRTRLIPTTLAASGKARFWDDAMPKMMLCLQLLDNMPTEKGGCGHAWTKANEAPVVTRSEVLPEDPMEEVTRHVAAVAGEVESVETAVRGLNPEADEDWINKELDMIKEDRTTFGTGGKNAPPPPGGGGDTPPPGADGELPKLPTPSGPERPTGPLSGQ